MIEGPASFQRDARAVEIDPHTEIEILFRLRAYNSGEMKNRVGIVIDQRFNSGGIADLARDDRQTRVVGQRRIGGDHIKRGNGRDFGFVAVPIDQLRCSQERIDELTADHSRATRNHNLHEASPCLRNCSFTQFRIVPSVR